MSAGMSPAEIAASLPPLTDDQAQRIAALLTCVGSDLEEVR